jgi:hypothetical protein
MFRDRQTPKHHTREFLRRPNQWRQLTHRDPAVRAPPRQDDSRGHAPGSRSSRPPSAHRSVSRPFVTTSRPFLDPTSEPHHHLVNCFAHRAAYRAGDDDLAALDDESALRDRDRSRLSRRLREEAHIRRVHRYRRAVRELAELLKRVGPVQCRNRSVDDRREDRIRFDNWHLVLLHCCGLRREDGLRLLHALAVLDIDAYSMPKRPALTTTIAADMRGSRSRVKVSRSTPLKAPTIRRALRPEPT